MSVRVIPELSFNWKLFLSLFIPLFTKYLVASLVISGDPFINSSVPASAAAYVKSESNSPITPLDCIQVKQLNFWKFYISWWTICQSFTDL